MLWRSHAQRSERRYRRHVPSCLLSWLVPAADPRSAWDALKPSQLSGGDGPSADIASTHEGGPVRKPCDPKIKRPCRRRSTVRERRKRASDRRAFRSHGGITSGELQPSPQVKVCLLVFELSRNVAGRGLGLDQPPCRGSCAAVDYNCKLEDPANYFSWSCSNICSHCLWK